MVNIDPGVQDQMVQLSNYLSSNEAMMDLASIPTMEIQQGDLQGVMQGAVTEHQHGVLSGGVPIRVPEASQGCAAGGIVSGLITGVQAHGDQQAGLQIGSLSETELQRQERFLTVLLLLCYFLVCASNFNSQYNLHHQ